MVSSRAHYPKQNIIFLRPDVKFSKKEYALHTEGADTHTDIDVIKRLELKKYRWGRNLIKIEIL